MFFDGRAKTRWGRDGREESVAARVVRSIVAHIECGHLAIVLPSGERIEGYGKKSGPSATLVVRRWRAIRRLVSHGDIGFAEAYIDDDWSSPDLAALLELAARNITVLDGRTAGSSAIRALNRLLHLLRTNSKAGSRRNIAFHYDLGNEFYRRWLDPSMTYSSALYESAGQSLEDAQSAKLSKILGLLDLRGGENVLEIGCGWGALAILLARAGAVVTGITLSAQQLAFAREQIRGGALDDKISFELRDYRDAKGVYDRIVSIEMMEAVGEAYWPVYFKCLYDRLKSPGIAVLQVITIDEARFQSYRRSADFIQRYIFPGGMLPTKSAVLAQGARAGLKLISTQSFGTSYALTLAEWRKRFFLAWPDIAAMGFSGRFRRLWDYYLCYCEAGFRAASIDVGLYVFAKG